MKRILCALAMILLLTGMVNAQQIDLISVSSEISPGVISTGEPIQFDFAWNNTSSAFMTGWSNGFRFWLSGGSRSAVALDEEYYDSQGKGCANQIATFINYFSNDGVGADTIGLGAYAMGAPGFVAGSICDMAHFTVTLNADAHGEQFCIDSTFFPPGGEWLWSDATAGYYPAWEGPHCFDVIDPDHVSANLVITPSTLLEFTMTEGAGNPANQSFTVDSDGDPLDFTLSDAASWLNWTPAGGTTSQLITVSIDGGVLTAGDYTDDIVVTSGDAENSPVTVTVNLHVDEPAADPEITLVSPATGEQGETVSVELTGSETAWGTGSGTTVTLSNAKGTITGINVNVVSATSIEVDFPIPGDADLGLYDVSVDETGVGVVTLTDGFEVLVGSNLVIDLDPAIMDFTGEVSGSNPPSQTFELTSDNNLLNFTIDDDAGASWLSAAPASGNTDDDHTITVSIDNSGLGEGNYSGTLTITSVEALNSPLIIAVNLQLDVLGTPVITSVIPNDATQGSSFTMNVLGDNTHFGTGSATIVRLTQGGTIITATSVSVVSTTELNADFTIPGGAPAGMYDVSVEDTGVETVTLVNAFAVIEASSITVLSPNGGETFAGESTMPISWTSTGSVGNVDIALSINGGGAWTDLVIDIPNDGAFDAIGIPNVDASECLVRIQVTGTGDPTDVSDGFFTITYTAPEYTLEVAPDTIRFAIVQDGDPESKNFTISESGDEVIDFTLTEDILWLSATPMSGNTPQTVEVTADPTGMGLGTSLDSIVATSDAAVNDPIYVFVELTINPPMTDSLMVQIAAVPPGSSVPVPVGFVNSQCHLTGADVALNFDPTYLTLDEVTFDGTATADISIQDAVIDNDAGTVVVSLEAANSGEWIAPGGGVLMNLWFTVDPSAPETFYPILYSSDPTFDMDCTGTPVQTVPWFNSEAGQQGGLMVGDAPAYVCGYVRDGDDLPLAGATVEIWSDFPVSGMYLTTTSAGDGFFEFVDFSIDFPYDLYAYMNGYYPDTDEDLGFYNADPVDLRLVEMPAIEGSPEFMFFFCDNNTYFDAPLPVGSVVDAFSSAGIHCGSFWVGTEGEYGYMAVYKADGFGGVGANPGEIITMTINGSPAATDPVAPEFWPEGTENLDTLRVCLDGGMVGTNVQLAVGWNLVSWNVITPSTDLEAVFSSITGKYEFIIGFESGGLIFDPGLPQFSTLADVDHLSGYWIKATEPTVLSIQGFPVPSLTVIPLVSGWNLVSYLPDAYLETEVALGSIDLNELVVAIGYDTLAGGQIYQPGMGGANTLDSMGSGHGYWLKTTQAMDLIYPGGGLVAGAKRPTVRQSLMTPLASVSRNALPQAGVETARQWVNLYGQNLELDGELITAGASIVARSAEGTIIGSCTATEAGTFGFMSVYSDKGSIDYTLEIDGVATEEIFQWTTFGDRTEVLSLTSKGNSTGTKPGGYSLSQNYPNPFNPTTTIEFEMAESGSARIEVFNLVGQLVAVPFDGYVQEGTHSMEWDGRSSSGQTVSSGIYLYRLTADNYTETKKMTLLK